MVTYPAWQWYILSSIPLLITQWVDWWSSGNLHRLTVCRAGFESLHWVCSDKRPLFSFWVQRNGSFSLDFHVNLKLLTFLDDTSSCDIAPIVWYHIWYCIWNHTWNHIWYHVLYHTICVYDITYDMEVWYQATYTMILSVITYTNIIWYWACNPYDIVYDIISMIS